MAIAKVNNDKKQPYFACYMKHKGLNVGDEFITYEYISWIENMHIKFKNEVWGKEHYYTSAFGDIYNNLFTEWLEKEVNK